MKQTLDWNIYLETASRAVAEGCVLLENKDQVLPFQKGMKLSIFGRIQTHYYKSGTGSGGMVNVSHVTDIIEGLEATKEVTINQELYNIYRTWEESNPFEEGIGWGQEPWCQKEMPLTDKIVKHAADASDAAIVIIGRTAGEEKDNKNEKGAYLLTDTELDMMQKVRAHFSKMVVLLNVGGIIDMTFVSTIQPDCVLYVWQGGMTGGHGIADVLLGKVSPSGHLTDTIAKSINDYPSNQNFSDSVRNFYCEDIYVGYRYFETFAPDCVVYPFGYGLSYTTFDIKADAFRVDTDLQMVYITSTVKNTGDYKGKEVVQIYACAPQGRLGKPVRTLIDFSKTSELAPGQSETLEFAIPFSTFASYDDTGITGHAFCYLLEQGKYEFHIGNNIRCTSNIGGFTLESDCIIEQLEQALAPVIPFTRYTPAQNDDNTFDIRLTDVKLQEVSAAQKRLSRLPEEIPYTGDKGISLADVLASEPQISDFTYDTSHSLMKDFIGQFSDEELCCFTRGEGMGSSLVTAGTASAFGGVSKKLRDYKIPAVCCDDGPSGMRLDCGAKAFSLPNGTLLACTFNTALNEELFSLLGKEMITNKVECLLGPGMNIHRHPLNGRNFEYFSEDPLVTGIIASAQLKGLKTSGVGGTVKHFCGNNQETERRVVDSAISERALREIYLKGFEIAVKNRVCDAVMTTYGKVNGTYTLEQYDLCTTILRGEWGFEGIVMTDWWAGINSMVLNVSKYSDFATMVRAQNDLYMVVSDGENNTVGENTLEELAKGSLTRGELQRVAMNVCRYAMHTEAMRRNMNQGQDITIINRPVDTDDFEIDDVEYQILDNDLTVSLKEPASEKGTNYILALDVVKPGEYNITITASSELGEVAQLPCTLFYNGFPVATVTFNGSQGKNVSITRTFPLFTRFNVLRLQVGANGLDLDHICFTLAKECEV